MVRLWYGRCLRGAGQLAFRVRTQDSAANYRRRDRLGDRMVGLSKNALKDRNTLLVDVGVDRLEAVGELGRVRRYADDLEEALLLLGHFALGRFAA